MLGHNASPGRIQEVIGQLNGIRRVRGSALSAFGTGDDGDLREFNGSLETDVRHLVVHLKSSSGFNDHNDSAKIFASHAIQFALAMPFYLGLESLQSKRRSRLRIM